MALLAFQISSQQSRREKIKDISLCSKAGSSPRGQQDFSLNLGVLRDPQIVDGSAGKESACNVGDLESLGWEDPLEKGKVTHYSNLAWRIPWTIQSMGLQSRT